MNKVLTINLTLLAILIIACGWQTPHASRPPQPATTSETVAQPTQPATSTNTPLPSPIATDRSASTAEASNGTPVASASFANDVLPIFENSCNKCHGVEQIKEGLDMRKYETLMAGSFNGTRKTVFSYSNCLMVKCQNADQN